MSGVDKFGMIDEAMGHEPLYWGKTNDVASWGISGDEYVRLADYERLASPILAGWAVHGAQLVRLFKREKEARDFAAPFRGVVHPVYYGPPMPLHQWTGDGPGVSGADNCQVCNRWSDEPETPTCRDRLDMEPGK